MTQGLGAPYYQIDILEPDGAKVPLRQDYLRLILSIELEQVWDGADELSITMRAWDEFDSDFRVVGERILEPGTSLILRAGYGTDPPHLMGRFDVAKHEPSFSDGDAPTVVLRCYDGQALFMDNTWPGDYGGVKEGTLFYSDVARLMARKYGMGLAADIGNRIKHKNRKVNVRKRLRGKVILGADGKAVRTPKVVKSRIIKNSGDTDAKMLKDLANYTGFLLPKVRYVEGLNFTLAASHALTENLSDRDVLFFRQASIQRQLAEGDAFDFQYRRRDGGQASLMQFDPEWNTDEVPIAVRITGIVKETVGTKRRRTKKRIVVVEAQLTDAEKLRERSNLLRRAARTSDPTKAAALLDKANSIQPKITVTSETRTRIRKQDKKRFTNAGTALVEILDKQRRPVKEFDRLKQRKLQTMRREVIGGTWVVTDGSELREIAKAWLATRLQMHITATATVQNIRKAETLYPNQVHTASGLPAEYEGPYMIRKVTHVWQGDAGHTVNMHLQRVAEAPSSMISQERAE